MEAVNTFAQNYLAAQEEAFSNMVESIVLFGKVSNEDAEKVTKFYIKKKWLKFDHMQRRYEVKSGNMFDKSFIKEALKVSK